MKRLKLIIFIGFLLLFGFIQVSFACDLNISFEKEVVFVNEEISECFSCGD